MMTKMLALVLAVTVSLSQSIGEDVHNEIPADVAPGWVPAYNEYKHLLAIQNQLAHASIDDPQLVALARDLTFGAMTFYQDPPGGGTHEWGRWWRNKKAELLLRGLAALRAKSGLAPTDTPPVAFLHSYFPGVNSGTAPSDIPDPAMRKRYEAAIAANHRAATITHLVGHQHRLLLSLQQLVEFFYKSDDAGRQEFLGAVAAFAGPNDQPWLTALAEKCGTGPASMGSTAKAGI